jgi:hypothetical protein
MIFSSSLCFLTLLSLFGYSYIFKKLIKNTNQIILNQDIFFGIFLAIFLSLFFNFFFPLKYFSLPVLILGIIFFIVGYKKKIYQIKLRYHLIFIFLINFFSFYNGVNVDSPMYHLQLINWMTLHKINLGITNLEIRFGMNSSWHSFLALMNISTSYFSTKFYLSSIIFSIICYESISKKKNIFLNDIYLFLSISFLITYSFLHPFVNGPILNQLGNPEVDTVSMFLYIFVLYLYLRICESEGQNKNYLINLFVILIFLSISFKISNISLILLLISIIITNKSYKILNISNVLVLFATVFWFIKNFLISSCIIYPIKFTCLNTSWLNISDIERHAKIIQSFARDTRLRDKYMNFDYTLYSNDWFLPWVNDYFFNTAILKISSVLFLLSFFILSLSFFFSFLKKKIVKINYNVISVVIFFVFSIYIWFKVPEVRFGYGFIISLPCFFLACILNKFSNLNYLSSKNIMISIFVLLFLLSSKHFKEFEQEHLIQNNRNNSDYTNIVKIGSFEGTDIYHSTNSQCGDYLEICVNEKKNSYEIISKFNYRIFLSDIK